MVFSPKSFTKDHLVRSDKGIPLGRLILREESFKIGEDLKVGILQIPKVFNLVLSGLRFWVDEVEYCLPVDISKLRIKDRPDSIIISGFVLKRYVS